MLDKISLSLLLVAGMTLAGCKQELPKAVDADSVFGVVTAKRQVDDQKQLIYTGGEDPYKKNWGLAAAYYVTVQGQDYELHWDQADKFKEIKTGDRVNLHPTEYIACIGEADLKPVCRRMMRVYKSERRVAPLQMKNQ